MVLRLIVPLAQTTTVPVHGPLFQYSHHKDKCLLNFTSLVWVQIWGNRCNSAALVQSLVVAKRIASAHLYFYKWYIIGMDYMTRYSNLESLTERERQSVSVMRKLKEQIWWYSADIRTRGMLLLVELSNLTDEAKEWPERNHAFRKSSNESLAQPALGRRKADTPQKINDQMIFFSKIIKYKFKNLVLK